MIFHQTNAKKTPELKNESKTKIGLILKYREDHLPKHGFLLRI